MQLELAQKTIDKYLKELRKSCNYSQEFVASHLNITRQTYSHYETGRIIPPVNSLYNLAKLYGVPVESFLELVVTYSINMDFAGTPQPGGRSMLDDLTDFLEYTNDSKNSKKFKPLNRQEKLLLYYFNQLDDRDKNDILDFMKIKNNNRKQSPENGT